MPELKRCPLCGGVPSPGFDVSDKHYVTCSGCNARTGLFTTIEAAIEAWNRRYSSEERRIAEDFAKAVASIDDAEMNRLLL